MSSNITTSIFNEYKERSAHLPEVSLSIQDYLTCDKHARLLVKASGKVSEDSLSAAIATMFDGKVSYCLSSANNDGQFVDLWVKHNLPTVAYSEEEVTNRGMAVVTANVFRDMEDNIWQVSGEGDSRVLSQTDVEDFSALLEARNASSLMTAALNHNFGLEYSAQDTVMWYDIETEVARVGIATSDSEVWEFATDSVREVPSELVIEVSSDGFETVVLDGIDNQEEGGLEEVEKAAGFSNKSFQRKLMVSPSSIQKPNIAIDPQNMYSQHLTYMRHLYGNHPKYFGKLTSLIRKILVDNETRVA